MRPIAIILAMLPFAASAQQTNWQDLALRLQQNATVDQMIANTMIAALTSENADLKAELAKLKAAKADPPESPK